MNEQSTTLPELTDASVARIEEAVFDRIADEPARTPAPPAKSSTARKWWTGAGIAAAFVVGVLVTGPILTSVNGTSPAADGWVSGADSAGSAADTGGAGEDMAVAESAGDGGAALESEMAAGDADREIIASAYVQVEVADIPSAVDAIGDLADEHGGYVESTDVSGASTMEDTSMPAEPAPGYGWISIRVPSADLSAVIDELADHGEVRSSSISQQDVTSAAIDLRARVEALEASVDRLTELMSQSATVSELIEAEVALTDRQSELESYQQQLAALEDQVAMSSVQVELVRESTPTTADPAGFGDGLLAGWNGLVVTLNALVVSLGFLLPWLAIAGVVVLMIWLIRRSRRVRKSERNAEEA